MFCFGIGLRGFSDRSTTNPFPFLLLCCAFQAVSWFIHQENEVSWQKFDRCLAAEEQGARLQGCLHPASGPSEGESLEVKFCPFHNKNSSTSHCSVSRQLEGLSQLWNFCRSVKNEHFACVRGGWRTLSTPDCCWGGGCLSPSRPQPVCHWTFPSLGTQVPKTHKREACKHLANGEFI